MAIGLPHKITEVSENQKSNCHTTQRVPMKSTVGTFERLVRRLWGLPTGRGFYAEHPSKPNARRVPGYLENVNGTTTLLQKDSWRDVEDATRERYKVNAQPPPSSKAGPREYERRTAHDFHVHSKENIINTTSGGGAYEGVDDCLRSVSLAEDVWHLLTVDMSLTGLLTLEIVLEFTFMFLSSVVLCLIATCEGDTLDSEMMNQKLLLSLTTVRISSDSIYGWQTRTPSTKPEIAMLALLGWAHWLLLSVAGAVIVARALKPLQQVAFAPDCVYDDQALSIRMMILRRHMILYDLQVRIQAFSGGLIMDLPLSNGTTGYARWTGVFPLTMKHNLDENSPITKKGMDSITNIAITVTAIDSDGKPVYAVAEYYNPRGWIAGRPEFQGWFKKKACYPRILRGKFGDQFRFFKVPNDSGLAHPSMPGNEQDAKAKDEPVTAPPVFLLDFDNFHVVHNEPELESPV